MLLTRESWGAFGRNEPLGTVPVTHVFNRLLFWYDGGEIQRVSRRSRGTEEKNGWKQ